jgi:hypothetical protein
MNLVLFWVISTIQIHLILATAYIRIWDALQGGASPFFYFALTPTTDRTLALQHLASL